MLRLLRIATAERQSIPTPKDLPMKILASLVAFLATMQVALAQDGADPWIKKKADSFKPLSAEQKAAIENAVPTEAAAKPKKARRLLVFYRCEGFIHSSPTAL